MGEELGERASARAPLRLLVRLATVRANCQLTAANLYQDDKTTQYQTDIALRNETCPFLQRHLPIAAARDKPAPRVGRRDGW